MVAVLREMEFDMLQPAWGLCLVVGVSVVFAQTPTPKPMESSIRVVCHGKIRHKVKTIGGETTGTTIEFNDGMRWELKLPDDTSRKFADDNHKEMVTAVGSLRRVPSKAFPERFIIEVDANRGLELLDDANKKQGASLTVLGTLRPINAAAGEPAGMAIEAGGTNWPLDLSADRAIKDKAESLVGKSVELVGRLERGSEAKPPSRPIIRVNKLDVSNGKTSRR